MHFAMSRLMTPLVLLLTCLQVSPSQVHAQESSAGGSEIQRRSTEQWNGEMKKFAQQDARALHKDVVFTGSSSVRMWKLEDSFGEDFQYINRGFGGSIINDNIVFMDKTILPYSPKVILLYAGDNDVGIKMPVEDVVADYRRFTAKLHKELPDAKLIYIAIKPSLARWEMWPDMKSANQQIAEICEASDWQYFGDIAPVMLGEDGKPMPGLFLDDGLHMNAEGYKRWTGVLRPLIDKALAADQE